MVSWSLQLNMILVWQPCPKRLRLSSRYHSGSPIFDFEPGKDKVAVKLQTGETAQCDLFVAADGPRSAVRQQLMPHVERRYAGYVAWRGVRLRQALCSVKGSMKCGLGEIGEIFGSLSV
jgi:2-polyprenyl-6-methoxyphenol hydroxylase-like FAD-dependent oxidoreductase